MRWFMDFFDSKPLNALLLGAVALPTLWNMDNDWHAIAWSLFAVAGYWLMFPDPKRGG